MLIINIIKHFLYMYMNFYITLNIINTNKYFFALASINAKYFPLLLWYLLYLNNVKI